MGRYSPFPSLWPTHSCIVSLAMCPTSNTLRYAHTLTTSHIIRPKRLISGNNIKKRPKRNDIPSPAHIALSLPFPRVGGKSNKHVVHENTGGYRCVLLRLCDIFLGFEGGGCPRNRRLRNHEYYYICLKAQKSTVHVQSIGGMWFNRWIRYAG